MQPATSFCVVLHDVAPHFAQPVMQIVEALRPLIGNTLAGAVVPCWHGRLLDERDTEFIALVRGRFGERLLHGYTHSSQGHGPLAWLSGQADEFAGITASEAMMRLQQGQAALTRFFGAPAWGFVPPAWQWGALTPALLASSGFQYGLGFAVLASSAYRSRLATWSWDLGRIAAAGYFAVWPAFLSRVLRCDAIPCIVLHPADLVRGFLPHALYIIRQLRAAGLHPVLPHDLVAL